MSCDWTRFEKKVFIDAGRERVFDAWALPNEITRWFIAQADYFTSDGRPRGGQQPIEAGDRYHWRWHQDLETQGAICQVIPGSRLVFTFGRVEGASEDVLVTVDVAPAADGRTVLTLIQENMPLTPAGQQFHLSCNLGWSFFMTNLKAVLEHDVDLRETDPELAMASRAISAT